MYETTADLNEAVHYEKLDADLLQAQYEAEARTAAARRAAGECLHTSSVGLPDNGRIYYPEQEGLKPGQVRCTEGCGQVFESEEEWHAATIAACA